ncbi:MAG TPA: hypothetical protein VFA33_05030 [Bryobacteraceae bacterium]|nr:hypothetical protein [Bryobacteraceae bacterium]
MSQEEAIRRRKVRDLRAKGYRRVETDYAGRIVVEVHEAHFSPEQHELFRRVWGPEWPVVRSEPWREKVPPESQFEFRSREY